MLEKQALLTLAKDLRNTANLARRLEKSAQDRVELNPQKVFDFMLFYGRKGGTHGQAGHSRAGGFAG